MRVLVGAPFLPIADFSLDLCRCRYDDDSRRDDEDRHDDDAPSDAHETHDAPTNDAPQPPVLLSHLRVVGGPGTPNHTGRLRSV